MTNRRDRLRFEVPLYTVTEAARIVGVPVSTLTTWAKGYVRRPPDRPDVVGEAIITYLPPEGPRRPSIPFVGLTEATVLAAIRRSGVPMQRIRPALNALESNLGLDHALASQRLYTAGRNSSTTMGRPTRIAMRAVPHYSSLSYAVDNGSSARRSRSTSSGSSTDRTAMPN